MGLTWDFTIERQYMKALVFADWLGLGLSFVMPGDPVPLLIRPTARIELKPPLGMDRSIDDREDNGDDHRPWHVIEYRPTDEVNPPLSALTGKVRAVDDDITTGLNGTLNDVFLDPPIHLPEILLVPVAAMKGLSEIVMAHNNRSLVGS